MKDLVQNEADQSGAAGSGDDAEVQGNAVFVQLVSFFLNEIEFAVDILQVNEILKVPDIARLPNTPSFIRGVINLRGNVIPVVDVRERFELSRAEITDLSRIVVVESADKLIGLLVDRVHQVVRIPEGDVEPPSDLIEGISEDFIRGVCRLSDRLIVMLNHHNLLFPDADPMASAAKTERRHKDVI